MSDTIDFDALTKAQQDATSRVACGARPEYHNKTLEALVRMGIIVKHHKPEFCNDGYGVRMVIRYTMPKRVAVQWRAWDRRKREAGKARGKA